MARVGRGRSFALGLLVGGLIGASLGLALAPERGEESRRRLRSRAQPAVDKAKDVVTRLARRGVALAEEGEPMEMPESEAMMEERVSEEVGDASESEGEDQADRPGELEKPEDRNADPARRRGRSGSA